MPKTVSLLLTENVESLGIVGDVVVVKMGYARNYLLPRQLATAPSEDAIADLAEKRAKAEKEMAHLRSRREAMVDRIEGLELTMVRSCNDAGHLYGSVTQKDIAEALTEQGYPVSPRAIRLPHAIKRIDTFDIHIRLDLDLEADIKLWVVPDRELHTENREDLEFDNEGNLIDKPKRKPKADASPEAAPQDAAPAGQAQAPAPDATA